MEIKYNVIIIVCCSFLRTLSPTIKLDNTDKLIIILKIHWLEKKYDNYISWECFLFSQVMLVLDDCYILPFLNSVFKNTICVVIAHTTFGIFTAFCLEVSELKGAWTGNRKNPRTEIRKARKTKGMFMCKCVCVCESS